MQLSECCVCAAGAVGAVSSEGLITCDGADPDSAQAGVQGQFQSVYGSQLQSNFTTQAISISQALGLCQNGAPKLPVVEATISKVHSAFQAKQLTCTQLVQAYVQVI